VLHRRSHSAAGQTAIASELLGSEMRGMLAGPGAYVRARREQSRTRVREVAP
jgi:hypothetical protein